MRREGNKILFDTDDEQRRFSEDINCAERSEKMIAAAMRACLSFEYEARRWWAEAKKLCDDNEQPVFRFATNSLTVETCEPESGYKWCRRTPAMEYLQRAKEYAVADKNWPLADEIRILMDQKRSTGVTASVAE